MSEASSAQYVGRVCGGRYELIKLLGEGGMGAVFAVYDRDKDQEVALKLLLKRESPHSRQMEKRMRREVKVLMLVDDRRVVRMLDWGQDPALGLFYTMELLPESQTLLEYLAQGIDLCERLRLFGECLRGLHAIHKLRVVHRDLKSNNFLCIQEEGQAHVKLIDFGLARWFDRDLRTQITVETKSGTILGTPSYMPPEMWRGDGIDFYTDLYQMGIMGYEVIAGTLPFIGTPHQIMFQHLYSALPPLTERVEHPEQAPAQAWEDLDDLLAKATSKDPEERYQDAVAFYRALQGIIEAHPSLQTSTQVQNTPAPNTPRQETREEHSITPHFNPALEPTWQAGEAPTPPPKYRPGDTLATEDDES